jgi:phosphatidylglycerophosphatase A
MVEKDSSQQTAHSAGDRVAIAIATALGAGYAPFAPGTAGSALSVGLWLVLYRWLPGSLHVPAHLALILALTIVGIWASTRSESWFGEIDPHQTVIDEVIGQQITYLGLFSSALSWKSLALGFFLFRLFDVWKPYPIRKIQDLHGGAGIVLDDVAAGIYALIVLFVVRRFLNW